jgi:hypothetical protein
VHIERVPRLSAASGKTLILLSILSAQHKRNTFMTLLSIHTCWAMTTLAPLNPKNNDWDLECGA